MKKMKPEEMTKKIFKEVIKNLLLSEVAGERSLDFQARDDKIKKEIESELNKASEEVTEIFVRKLKKSDYFEKDATDSDIMRLIKDSIKEYKKAKKSD